MPYVNFDDAQSWLAMYSMPFVRAQRMAIMGDSLRDITNMRLALEAKGMKPTDAVAILGAGYGWSVEEFLAAGYQNVIACDTSAYIHANKNVNAVVTIYNEGAQTNNSKRTVRQLLNRGGNSQKIDWAITEDILPCFTDAEISQYAPHLRDIATNVAHWVSCTFEGATHTMDMNWKTRDSWKAFMTPDWIVQRGTNVAV
jgi:hypothetical protein